MTMPEFDCRVHFLCWKLRIRILEAAEIQSKLTEDIQLFQSSDDQAMGKFKETRQQYLDLLDMSLSQLRMMMATSDSDISVDDLMVERIMKRVKPVPEEYLARLVAEGKMTADDMDCIVAGGYNDIEQYYDDLDANAVSVGSSLGVSSLLEDLHITSDTDVSKDYDDDGILIEHYETDEDDEEDVDGTPAPELTLKRTSSHRYDTLSVVDPLAEDAFDWAEDVEEELEMLETEDALAHQSSTTTVTVTPITPEDEYDPSDVTSSDISDNSMTDPETEAQESDNSSIYVTSPGRKSGEVEVPDSDSEPEYEPRLEPTVVDDAWSPLNSVEKAKSDATEINDTSSAIDDTKQPDSPTYQVPLGTILRSDSDSDTSSGWDRDQIMDIWVKEHDMPYWQWEMLFTLKLTAQKYQREFEEARAAYKADPFNDGDWR
ncbi:hypothetical protein GGR53DRAFT_153258 [Hypoxylon sp. FL1150]|nr:hypothetical protein GGR53DRAFT_153258 [Hypoxylon sp. FL1150]